MNLPEAYRILEVPVGASEDAVREARKTLAKVWHPDRHANDPQLQARAQTKLADINAAFELVSEAGFPSQLPGPRPAPEPPKPRAEPPKPPAEPPKPPTAARPPSIELVPRRRVRWSVILLLAAALGVGAYFAIVRLGRETTTPPVPSDATTSVRAPDDASASLDAGAGEPRDAAPVVEAKTFTLESSRDEVIAAQGDPQGDSRESTSVNGVRRSKEQLTYGTFSTVELVDGKVVEWWERDVALHVRMEPVDPAIAATARTRGTISVGSTRDEVIGVLGAPTQVSRAPTSRWSYSFSFVELDGAGHVSKIWQGDREIPITP